MGKPAFEFRNKAAVFFVSLTFVEFNYLFKCFISRAGFFAYGNALPVIAVNTVFVGVDGYVKSSDLIGARSRLHDNNIVYNLGLGDESMRMTSDDNIHTPRRVKPCGKLFVFLKADVCILICINTCTLC